MLNIAQIISEVDELFDPTSQKLADVRAVRRARVQMGKLAKMKRKEEDPDVQDALQKLIDRLVDAIDAE